MASAHQSDFRLAVFAWHSALNNVVGRRPTPLLVDDCFVRVQFLVPVLMFKQLVALFNQLPEPADGFGRLLVVLCWYAFSTWLVCIP